MAGSIRKHTTKGRSPWYTIWAGGQDHHLGTDLSEALRKASLLLDGKPVSSSPETVAGLCYEWRNAKLGYWKVKHFGDWADEMALADLSDLSGYAKYLSRLTGKRGEPFKPASIRDYCRHARTCLQWAIDQGWKATVPPMPTKLPKRVRNPRDIDPTVLRAALEKIRHAKHIIRFIVATGCRPSEACNLKWEQISTRSGTAIVGDHKTAHHGKSRTIYLTPSALAVLAEVKTKAGPVFLSRLGKPYTPGGLRAILKRRGIPGAYCLRHTAAQDWLEQGIDFGVVAGLLGHGDLRTVQVYAQVRDRKLSAAAKGIRGIE
jgi:integrase